jgi:cytochrome bd ubiquinol oxidase subunit II
VPLVTGVALPALYIPLMLMLFSLIARGVALELIDHHDGWHPFWGRLFGIGSLLAGFCQGAAFGGLVAGLPVQGDTFAGGSFTFLHHGYAVLTGLTAVSLYLVGGARTCISRPTARRSCGRHRQAASLSGRSR